MEKCYVVLKCIIKVIQIIIVILIIQKSYTSHLQGNQTTKPPTCFYEMGYQLFHSCFSVTITNTSNI